MSQLGRPFPTGGDPNDFCVCGHHLFCHAAYANMPSSCNQTGCGCMNYQHESANSIAKIAKLLGCEPDYISIDLAIAVLIGQSAENVRLRDALQAILPVLESEQECREQSYLPEPMNEHEEQLLEEIGTAVKQVRESLEVKTNG
jgi:hypothetical protein